jgi:uncharacterized membrane protein YkoI
MLILAAALSVFALVLVGGVTMRLTAQSPAPTPSAMAVATASPAPQVGVDPTAVQALIAQRDQSYQQRIREANERIQQTNEQLKQAYQKQRSLATQLNQAYRQATSTGKAAPAQPPVQAQPAPQPTPAPAAPTYAVSPDMAVTIAMNVAPGAKLARQPELVNFQGAVAYEVMLDTGAVYVDANSGQILFNGTAVAGSGGHQGGEHEGGEHEGGEQEHDD